MVREERRPRAQKNGLARRPSTLTMFARRLTFNVWYCRTFSGHKRASNGWQNHSLTVDLHGPQFRDRSLLRCGVARCNEQGSFGASYRILFLDYSKRCDAISHTIRTTCLERHRNTRDTAIAINGASWATMSSSKVPDFMNKRPTGMPFCMDGRNTSWIHKDHLFRRGES